MSVPRTLAQLDADRTLVEAAVGRQLRQAETVIDVVTLDAALKRAKDALHAAIDAERKRAVRRSMRTGHPIRLERTRAMLKPLERLHRLGRREARAELARLGLQPRRSLEVDPEIPALDRLAQQLRSALNGFSVRLQIEHDRKLAQLRVASAGPVADALADALLKVPGGRGIAAGLVSKALIGGIASTFEENSDLVDRWEYTAVLDGGTCEICAPLDGSTYGSLDELFQVLPEFGPNPGCLGGGRCRCRAVPAV